MYQVFVINAAMNKKSAGKAGAKSTWGVGRKLYYLERESLLLDRYEVSVRMIGQTLFGTVQRQAT